MNGPFDEELLSAYHDGELPETDRQPVVDRIAEESELRELLDDYAELSGALKSLPRPEAPAELHAAVMNQVRDSAVVRPKRETPRSSRRKLWLWTAGTAASLLVAAGLFGLINGPPGGSGTQLAQNDSDEMSAVAPATVAEERADAGGFGGGASLQMAQVEMPADETRRSMDSRALESQLQELLRLDDLEPGQQLHVLQSIDDQLVLIEFQVVDVDTAFGEVQVLLDELKISKLESGADDVDTVAASENRLRGILVDASRETMLAALDQIDRLESVVVVDTNGADMALELGVEPELIPTRMHQQPPVEASAAPSADAALEPDSTAPLPAAQSRALAAPGAQDPTGAAFADAGHAYQVPLSLSGDVVREIEVQQQQQQARQQAAGASSARPSERDAQVPQDGSAAVADGGRTRSRILLIFKSESVPGTP